MGDSDGFDFGFYTNSDGFQVPLTMADFPSNGDFVGPPAEFAGDSLSYGGTPDYSSPTNGPRGTGVVTAGPDSSGSIFQTLKYGADSLLGVYRDVTGFQLSAENARIQQETARLQNQTLSARNNATAAIADTQAHRDVALAQLQAQRAVLAAQNPSAFGNVKPMTLALMAVAAYFVLKGKAA